MPTVLITGANRGLGLEFALQYAADGWRVHACCRNPSTASDLAELAGSAKGQVVVHRLDPGDFSAVDALADELSSEPIDLLLNNAGSYTQGGYAAARPEQALGNSDFEDWQNVFRINVFAPMKMAEAFVDHLASAEQGKLVTISSNMGSIGLNDSGGSYGYRSSKAAVNCVMRSLSLDLAEKGIIVALLLAHRARLAEADDNVSATNVVVSILTVLLGLAMTTGFLREAIVAGGVMTLILSMREQLHGWLRTLSAEDVRAVAIYGAITLVVLPLLPDKNIGPYAALNPRNLWLVVVFVTGLSFAGYWAAKRVGDAQGTIIAAAIGATYSSTAVTAELSRRHNNANVISIGERTIPLTLALEIVDIWLQTPFESGRHERRVAELAAYEAGAGVSGMVALLERKMTL